MIGEICQSRELNFYLIKLCKIDPFPSLDKRNEQLSVMTSKYLYLFYAFQHQRAKHLGDTLFRELDKNEEQPTWNPRGLEVAALLFSIRVGRMVIKIQNPRMVDALLEVIGLKGYEQSLRSGYRELGYFSRQITPIIFHRQMHLMSRGRIIYD